MGMTVTLGEIMLRLKPEDNARFVQADNFRAVYGGAEANVAVGLANMGENARFVSKLPAHSIGQAAVNSLRRYGVDTSCILRGGSRIGTYYLERGASQRADQVIYDRDGSAFALSEESEYDWEAVFTGANWFHFTGITPALGENCLRIVERACREAKTRGLTVSCDINYRRKLWEIGQARPAMERLLPYADVCITNESQAAELFGVSSAGENGEELIAVLSGRFGFKMTALTYRRTRNANRNTIWAALSDGHSVAVSRKYEMDMVDRIGGGDAFAAGLIYACLHGFGLQKSVDFAEAASCLKHSVEGDQNLVSAEEVEQIANGGAKGRVQR